MTKSDRKRVLAALERWEKKWAAAFDDCSQIPATQMLGAGVDWLRAMTKLADEYLDPEDTGWTECGLLDASLAVRQICVEYAAEVRGLAKKL